MKNALQVIDKITNYNNKTNPFSLFILTSIILFSLTSCVNDNFDKQAKLKINLVKAESAKSMGIKDIGRFDIPPFTEKQLINFNQNNQTVLLRVKLLENHVKTDSVALVVTGAKVNYVEYFLTDKQGQVEYTERLSFNSSNMALTTHNFAFEVQPQHFDRNHYLLIAAKQPQKVSIDLLNTLELINHDVLKSKSYAFIAGFMSCLVVFGTLLFIYKKDKVYLFFALFVLSATLSTGWQNGLVNSVPLISHTIIGIDTYWIFIVLADLWAFLMTLNLIEKRVTSNLYIRTTAVIITLRLLAILLYSTFQAYTFNKLMTFTSVISYVSIIGIVVKLTALSKQQNRWLLSGWLLSLIIGLLTTLELFIPNTQTHPVWLNGMLLLSCLFFSAAIVVKNIRVKAPIKLAPIIAPRNQSKDSKVDREFYLKRFIHKIERLANDESLNRQELFEKLQIKFYLLLNRGLPIKNAFIMEDEQLAVLCKTKFNNLDIEHLKTATAKALKNNNKPSIVRGEDISLDRKLPDIIFVPLSPEKYPNTIMVFGLKKSADARDIKGITGFCNLAYQALQKGRALCEKASTNNLDMQSGLYNSAAIKAIIKKSLKKGLITVVASIEVTNLRDIKKNFDEKTYDQCVKELAYHLNHNIEAPSKIGRIDNSRFMVVFSSVDSMACESTLFKVMREVSKQTFSLQDLSLSINIGLAESHMNETRKRLVQRAELALNGAIAKGPNRMEVFHSKIKLAEAI